MAGSYFIKRGEKVIGPMSPDALKDRIGDGKIRETDQVAKESSGPWKSIGDIPALASLFESDDDPFDAYGDDAYGDDAYGDDAYGMPSPVQKKKTMPEVTKQRTKKGDDKQGLSVGVIAVLCLGGVMGLGILVGGGILVGKSFESKDRLPNTNPVAKPKVERKEPKRANRPSKGIKGHWRLVRAAEDVPQNDYSHKDLFSSKYDAVNWYPIGPEKVHFYWNISSNPMGYTKVYSSGGIDEQYWVKDRENVKNRTLKVKMWSRSDGTAVPDDPEGTYGGANYITWAFSEDYRRARCVYPLFRLNQPTSKGLDEYEYIDDTEEY